ncbi:MAG: glycosyltransferase family 87 protein [Pseudomonadota bacterium]
MRYPLKHAEWLTPRRIISLGVVALVMSCFPTIYLLSTSNGSYDVNGKLLGTDYSAFWSAGRFALDGHAGDAYDLALQDEHLDSLFDGPSTPLTAWLHPPTFYLVVTPFAMLPYLVSLSCWIGVGLAAFARMIRSIDPRATAVLLAFAFPPVLTNVPHGQTGMLFAALFGGALLCLDRRPFLAGLMIGLMTFKPHLGPLIPFVLLIGGHYKAMASATLTAVSLIIITTAWLGPQIWLEFYQSFDVSRGVILESGGVGWFKLQSVYATLRIWGIPIELAYTLHAAMACLAALMVFAIWARPIDQTLKFAALIAGSSLVSPYIYDYDLAMLAPAIGWVILHALRNAFLTYEKSGIAFVALAPAFSRAMSDDLHIPLGLLASMVLFGIIVRRALHGTNSAKPERVETCG